MNPRNASFAAAACAFFLANAVVQAAPAHPQAKHSRVVQPTFDVRLYESYVRAHHQHTIPYRDAHGKVTPFAAAWMLHRKLCGGAVTGITTNPTTLSSIQEWQGCSGIRRIDQTTVQFHAEAWMK